MSALGILTAMVFWGQIQNYMMRGNLNFLIVKMVNESSVVSTQEDSNATTLDLRCPLDNATQNAEGVVDIGIPGGGGSFEWNAWERAFLLGAFSYGYICTQIIGGRLTEIYGVKRVYGFGICGSGILTMLSPWAAHQHLYFFIAIRVCIGLLTGVTFPSLHAMTARWVPPEERSRFISRCYFGTTFGLVITFPMCAVIASYWRWDGAFYAIGIITLIWFAFWCRLVYDSPHSHPRIDSRELAKLTKSLGDIVDDQKHPPVPWRAISTSIPFFGILITDMGNTFGIVVLSTNGPTFLKFMLDVDLILNALISGVPMMCRYFGGVFLSLISDCLIRKKVLSITNTRRIFNSISQIVPALCIASISLFSCDWVVILVLLCVGMFFNGAISAGHFSSHVDLAPNFAGTLMGLSNTFSGGMMGFVAPLVVAAITQEMTLLSWSILFWLTGVIYTIGNIFYVLMISGEVQPWNFPQSNLKVRQSEAEHLNA